MAGRNYKSKSHYQTQFKSLSPDHGVAELLAIKIKQESERIEDDKICSYFETLFNWGFISLGINDKGHVHTLYSDHKFWTLEEMFPSKKEAN